MHSSLHVFSLHSKKVVGGLDVVPGCWLGCDTAVDLAVLHLFHLGEQMLMIRMLGGLLGHLVDLQILGETRLHVERTARPWGGGKLGKFPLTYCGGPCPKPRPRPPLPGARPRPQPC
jgi:hypothetical protein